MSEAGHRALSAETIIARLALEPHPEGGHYRETYRDHPAGGGRGAMTSIYYLLRQGERSAWHRIDAAEIWHFYAGAPLELTVSCDGIARIAHRLAADHAGIADAFAHSD